MMDKITTKDINTHVLSHTVNDMEYIVTIPLSELLQGSSVIEKIPSDMQLLLFGNYKFIIVNDLESFEIGDRVLEVKVLKFNSGDESKLYIADMSGILIDIVKNNGNFEVDIIINNLDILRQRDNVRVLFDIYSTYRIDYHNSAYII